MADTNSDFGAVFGIGEGDAKLLEYVIREQLPQAGPREPVTRGGDPPETFRRWELVIPRFRGPNGNVSPVLTDWALDRARDLPHLTTALPLGVR